MSEQRISVIIPSLDRGGTETQLLAVLPRLAHLGFHVDLVTLAEPGALAQAFREEGIPVHGLLGSKSVSRSMPRFLIGLISLPALVFWLRAQRPEFVHTFLPLAGIVGGLAALVCRSPHLITSRRNRNFYQRRYPLAGFMERSINRCAQAVVANSRQVVGDLIGEGVSRERIVLIHNGVRRTSTSLNRDAARLQLNLDQGCLVFVVVANLIAYKGHSDLLEAFALAAPEIKADWRLLLVGRDDGIGAQLRAQALNNGFADRVTFAGECADVRPYVTASDIGILPSHEEGFSNAVLEGMEAGLAMVATNVGGNAEALEDGRCGLIVPSRAPKLLAAAIVRLALDPDLRKALGMAARKRAHEHFDIDQAAGHLAALYSSLQNGESVPAHLAGYGCSGDASSAR